MADQYPVPTLSTDGFVRNTPRKVDYLLGHFFVSEKSQDPFFTNVASFPWLIATYGGSEIDITAHTQETLKDYFSVYFPRCDIRCSISQINGNPNSLRLHIEGTVTDNDGVSFDLNNVVKVENSKVVEIARQNNGTLSIYEGY